MFREHITVVLSLFVAFRHLITARRIKRNYWRFSYFQLKLLSQAIKEHTLVLSYQLYQTFDLNWPIRKNSTRKYFNKGWIRHFFIIFLVKHEKLSMNDSRFNVFAVKKVSRSSATKVTMSKVKSRTDTTEPNNLYLKWHLNHIFSMTARWIFG